MLYEAAVAPGSPRRDLEEVLSDPRNARFVDGWGRSGDLGVIAEDDGRPLGAAWLRLHAGDEVRSGYTGAPIAQLAIAVVPEHRSRGWGRRLLEGLLESAERAGVPEVQLAVGWANEVAVRLYESTGFEIVVTDGRSARMRRRLGRDGGHPPPDIRRIRRGL